MVEIRIIESLNWRQYIELIDRDTCTEQDIVTPPATPDITRARISEQVACPPLLPGPARPGL